MISLFNHYKKLLFFTFNRFKDNNYLLMREYFAQIFINEIEEFVSLWNKKILDVGGANGEFCKIISEKRKCNTVNLEPYPERTFWPKTIIGYAENMPFNDNKFDIVICRGVLEHIEKQQQAMDEIYRVIKKNGICYIMIQPWYNPNAGHHLKPFHIFPFRMAKLLRELFFDKIDNYLVKLYPITFKGMCKMIEISRFKIIKSLDTHLKLHFLTKISLVREIAIPSVAFILIK